MSKNAGVWMPLYIGDYLRDTSRLTTEGHGAYLLLIMDYWSNAQPLPDDDRQLAAIVKMSLDEWQKLRPILIQFFQIDSGLWSHQRINKELQKCQRLHDARSKAGSKGIAKRQQNASKAPRASQSPFLESSLSRLEIYTPRARGENENKSNGLDNHSFAGGNCVSQRHSALSDGKSSPAATKPPTKPQQNVSKPKNSRNTKELLRNKLLRFADARLNSRDRKAAIRGLCGTDPNPQHDDQWWLDKLDARMRAEKWTG